MAAPSASAEDAAGLARSLGPTAFAALVVLAADAERSEDGRLVVAVSARSLASRLGVGKDAAARALRHLTAAGRLDEAPQGKADTGRFAASVRALRWPRVVGPCPLCGDTVSAPPAAPRQAGRRAPASVAQLGLFDGAGDDDVDGSDDHCLTSQNSLIQVPLIQSPSLPSLFTQSLKLSNQALLSRPSIAKTRLHQGCGGVAGDVATAPPEAPEARPC